MTPSFFLLFWCVVEIVGYGLSLLLIAIFFGVSRPTRPKLIVDASIRNGRPTARVIRAGFFVNEIETLDTSKYSNVLRAPSERVVGSAPVMTMKAEHTVIVEPLGNDRFALMIDGLAMFVSHDFAACVQRAEMILRSNMSTRARDDQALPGAIRRL
jgi:hypothetical protein